MLGLCDVEVVTRTRQPSFPLRSNKAFVDFQPYVALLQISQSRLSQTQCGKKLTLSLQPHLAIVRSRPFLCAEIVGDPFQKSTTSSVLVNDNIFPLWLRTLLVLSAFHSNWAG